MSTSETPAGGGGALDRPELRRQIIRALDERGSAIANQAVAVFPFTSAQSLDPEDAARLADATLQLLVSAIREGKQDPRHHLVADLRRSTHSARLPNA
jgi:hypothetical protein